MVLTIQSIRKGHKVFFSFSSQHRLKTCDRHHSIIDDTFAAVVLTTTVRIICFNNEIIKILCNSLTGYQPCGFYQINFFQCCLREQNLPLVPELDLSIPAASDDLRSLVWVPQGADAHFVVGFDSVVQFCGFPIPNVEFPICIS